MPAKPRIALLAGEGWSTHAMYNGLRDEFEIVAVIVERKPAALKMLRHRARTLGWRETFGQFCFILYSRWLSRAADMRIAMLMHRHGLSDTPIPGIAITSVESANQKRVAALLKKLAPQAVVVNGTRILSKKLLATVDAPFINTHMGITPAYRGVMAATGRWPALTANAAASPCTWSTKGWIPAACCTRRASSRRTKTASPPIRCCSWRRQCR
jgi:hypothetical protein